MKEVIEHCNVCGEVIDDSEKAFDVITQLGYGSTYDGDTIDFAICHGCFEKKLIAICKISPVVEALY